MTSRPSGKPASLRRRSCRSWESPLPQRKLLARRPLAREKGGSYERTSYPKFIAREVSDAAWFRAGRGCRTGRPGADQATRTLDVVYAAQDEAIPQGGAFAAGHQTSILSMDPAATGEPQVRTIRNCVTEALFDLDPEANLIPRLAESWEQTDETTYVIKLRQGVKFHDGNPFDAEVVKFNLERMLNPETQNVWRRRSPNSSRSR